MSKPILFIDGYCVLCNGLVTWLSKRVKAPSFTIASLQNEEAVASVPHTIPSDNSTLVWWDGKDTVLVKSNAVLAVSQHLKGAYPALGKIASAIPRTVRDTLYMWVSRNRYRWFGKKDACGLPNTMMRSLEWQPNSGK